MAARAAAAGQAAGVPLEFRLTPTTRLLLHRESIVGFEGDVLVICADRFLSSQPWHSTGVAAAVHRAAGPELLAACTALPFVAPGTRCEEGGAVMTPAGSRLRVRHVVHAVGPCFDSRPYVPASALLGLTYQACLALANDQSACSIAFPAISCGGRGFPPDVAAEAALRACAEAAGGVQEIHFFLPARPEAAAFERHARETLEQLPTPPPPTPAAEPSVGDSRELQRLMRAAQEGRQQEVLDLLASWAATLAGPPAKAGRTTPGKAAAVGEEAVGEVVAPGSSSPRDSVAPVSTPLSGTLEQQQQQQQQQQQASSSRHARSSSDDDDGAIDVRRWMYDHASLRRVRRLGSGSFGEVWLMADRGGTIFAVKELFRPDSSGSGGGAWSGGSAAHSLSGAARREFRREARLMAGLLHPHVVQFLGICLQPPCIVTEFCQHGSLYDALQKAAAGAPIAQQLTWPRRLSLLWGTAKGMLALHSHQPPIIHRDLRSPNILISGLWVAKVADFNLSRFADDSSGARSVLSVAAERNPRWMAPETLASIMEKECHPATKASDVYSFGMVMYEVLTWQIPWQSIKLSFAVIGKISQGERPPVPPREQLPGMDACALAGLGAYCELMAQCWAEDPAARPAFEEVSDRLKQLLQEARSGAAAEPEAAGPRQ